MRELKCPKCGNVFSVDEADYAAIVNQVKGAEFDAEVSRRIAELHQKQEIEEKARAMEAERAHQNEIFKKDQAIADKDRQIAVLQEKVNKSVQDQEIAILKERAQAKEASLAKDEEIANLKSQAVLASSEAALREKSLREEYEGKLRVAEEEVERYKDFKAKRSVKLLGEDLEQHCYALYNQSLLPVMPNATFEKDNESVREDGEIAGTKGDFIFRDKEDGVEYISIMFEMKNEGDVSTTKHRNQDFYAKLDSDRKKKGCEYAVLVSMLELDNDLFSGINVVPGYEKMYMVRPDQFLPIITLLVQSAKNSLEAKKQLVVARNQSIDLSHFEEDLLKFKETFGKNVVNAKKKYDEAIKGIDKTIQTMEAIKQALQVTAGHLDAAENKVENLTVKKLTRGNPTVKAMLDEAREKKAEAERPDEQ